MNRFRPMFNGQLAAQLHAHASVGRESEDPEVNDGSSGHQPENSPSKSPSKPRSLSDATPSLSPSPSLQEPRRSSKDDSSLVSEPSTPSRPSFHRRGLSLQMPSVDNSNPQTPHLVQRLPLSPKLDASTTYGAPASALPRRTRGLDFSRACTNLHHSTLAEQSSPDSSPTITGKGMAIPARKSFATTSSNYDAFGNNVNLPWSAPGIGEKNAVSSSLSSVNMIDSDSTSSSSEDDLMDNDDGEDTFLTTPQVNKVSNIGTPLHASQSFETRANASPGGDWLGHYSPAAASLMSFQRRIRRKNNKTSRHSSSSASAGSSMASPTPASPPLNSIEGSGSGYFGVGPTKTGLDSRRESLSYGTKDLRISSAMEADDLGIALADIKDSLSEEKRGVIRRPVTRRGNLLPKTKGFARIRAALMEEGAPVDTETRREAEVIRQVRESDLSVESSGHGASSNSPSLLPQVPGISDSLEDIPEDDMMVGDSGRTLEKGLSKSFTQQALKNSGGMDFWDNFDRSARTPPPPNSDVSSGSPMVMNPFSTSSDQDKQQNGPEAYQLPSAAEMSRKIHKRRRDDDFADSSIKRRAVSPGLSVTNSPTLAQSPGSRDGWWGKIGRENSSSGAQASAERHNSGGSVSSTSTNIAAGTKRVGLQGMTDTNDGLMKMSIE